MENTLLAGRCSHVSQNGHAADCSDVAIVIGVNPIHVAVGMYFGVGQRLLIDSS